MPRRTHTLTAVPDALATVPAPTPAAMTMLPADDRLLSVERVADVLGMSIPTVYRMVRTGKFPRPIAIDGGTPPKPGVERQLRQRWSSNEVQAWIAAQLATRRAG